MEHIKISRAGAIATLTLDRPKVNAMNKALLAELGASLCDLAADDAVLGVLLRGEGKCFSAGLDLNEVLTLDDDGTADFIDVLEDGFMAAFRFPKPLAAAVHGHAIAGGLVLPLCADHVAFATGDYKVGLTELQVGIPFPPSAWEILKHAIPPRALRQLVYGADNSSPADAFELGVGDALVDDPVADALAWLEKVTARPQATFCYVKKEHRKQVWRAVDELISSERSALLEILAKSKRELIER